MVVEIRAFCGSFTVRMNQQSTFTYVYGAGDKKG